MAGSVRPNELTSDGDLDGIADEADAGFLALERVADPIGGAGETDRTRGVHDPQHLAAGRGSTRPRGLGPAVELPVVVIEVALGVGGDEHALMAEVQQASTVLDVDRAAGQMPPDVIAEGEDADPTALVDHPLHPTGRRRWCLGGHVAVDDLEGLARATGGQLEASPRRDVADALVLSFGVVALHPGVEGCLGGVDGLEGAQVEELPSHGPVQALDLSPSLPASRGR